MDVGPILCVCVCITINSMLKLMLTRTQTLTQTLCVNRALLEAFLFGDGLSAFAWHSLQKRDAVAWYKKALVFSQGFFPWPLFQV